MAVEMRLGGASMEEISKKANRPVGTIKRWAHEGMNKLQEALSGRI
jgi:DNA-directed RNA polymerase specialized sigma24 family protein